MMTSSRTVMASSQAARVEDISESSRSDGKQTHAGLLWDCR